MRQIIGKSGPSLTSNAVKFDTSSLDTMQKNTLHRLLKKPKRFRSAFTTEQISFLEQQFKKFPYVNTEKRKTLAAYLHIEERSIKIWFQNRRMKEKKESNKECNDETIGNAQKFSKNQFNNVPAVPSANGQCSYSLPILLSTTDTATETNIDKNTANNVEHKDKTMAKSQHRTKHNEPKASHIKANFYTEATKDEHFSPYFNRQPNNYSNPRLVIEKKKQSITTPQEHNVNTSAEFSINLCKKYKQGSVGYNNNNNDVNENIAYEGVNINMKNLEPKPTSQIDKSNCRYPEKFNDKKPKISCPPPPKQPAQFNLNHRAYYPVISPMYGPSFVTPGSVLWNPVNFMPVMATSAATVAIPNSQEPQAYEQSKCCKCNCNGNTQQTTTAAVAVNLSSSLQNPCAQYLISVPYQHTSPKF